jgi:hypothetical protein
MQAWLIVADTIPRFISKVTTNLKQQTQQTSNSRPSLQLRLLKMATSRILPTSFT